MLASVRRARIRSMNLSGSAIWLLWLRIASIFTGRSKTGPGDAYPDFLVVDSETLQPLMVIETKASQDDFDKAIGEEKTISPELEKKLREALALISQPREFCILVSDTIRWYLEERFDFRAPERTTEEFLYELQETNLLTPDQKVSLSEFLKRFEPTSKAKAWAWLANLASPNRREGLSAFLEKRKPAWRE